MKMAAGKTRRRKPDRDSVRINSARGTDALGGGSCLRGASCLLGWFTQCFRVGYCGLRVMSIIHVCRHKQVCACCVVLTRRALVSQKR